jgi:hypothetical protein
MSVRQYVSTSVHQYTIMRYGLSTSVRQHVSMPVRQYVSTSVRQYASMSVCQYISTSCYLSYINPNITRLFKEAYDTFPLLKGKPTNNNLLAIRETLLPLLMVILYDQLLGVHFLTAILVEAAKYKADHGGTKFVRPSCPPLYDKNIANDAITVICVCAKAAHKSHLDNYAC